MIYLRAAEKREEAPFFIFWMKLKIRIISDRLCEQLMLRALMELLFQNEELLDLTATVAKASTGAIEYVPVVRVTNLARTIEELKERGVWIVGTDAKGSDDYRDIDGDMPLALVIGSEGKGISRLIKEKCDFLIQLADDRTMLPR